jgi:hypothetical protein
LAKSFLEINKWDNVCSVVSRKEREFEVNYSAGQED